MSDWRSDVCSSDLVAFDAALDIRVDFGFESAESATAKLLARGQDIDGIVATSDLIALGAIRALRKGGRMVPKDVSVVGFDEILLAQPRTPPHTTIQQATAEHVRHLAYERKASNTEQPPQSL